MSISKRSNSEITDLIHNEEWDKISSILSGYHPADIADIINHSPPDAHDHLFSMLHNDIKPEVMAELEANAETDVLESLSNSEISDIVEDMAPDDAADILIDLPEERSEKVLELMEEEESKDVRKLLEYPEDTAGGIMTTDVVTMHENQTVQEAIEAIAYLDTHEPFFNANIIDNDDKLIGFIDIWELLRERNRSRSLGELIHRDFTVVTIDTDQEQVAYLMSKYDLTVIPVIDANGKLVGRITADDAIDVINEEASEDILKLAGSDEAELESTSAIKSCILRLPWLFITLSGGFITTFILSHFYLHIAKIMVLAVFVPIVMAMGGNTGIQSSTLVVRSIALGHLRKRNIFKLLLREITTGTIMGCICGVFIGIGSRLMLAIIPAYSIPVSSWYLSITVGIALFSAMTFAAIFGAIVPIILNKIHIDPAIASGPFVSVTNDISALLIYFAVTILLIHKVIGLS